jgi:cytochrome c
VGEKYYVRINLRYILLEASDGGASMKWKTVLVMGAVLSVSGASAMAADEGAALFKSKCAGCHGANGEGKPAMKAPALKGTSLDADGITAKIMKGSAGAKAPHNKGISSLKESQAKAIADYVKGL